MAHIAKTGPKAIPLSGSVIKKWFYEARGYYKYGLYINDVYNEGLPEVKEALRRLPKAVRDDRNWRIVRAVDLSLHHDILPKEEWLTYQQDEQNRYLDPYLKEIVEEREEKEQWEKNH